VVLGPERLPKVARQMAALWKELTRVRDQVSDEVRKAMPDVNLPNIPRIPSPSSAIANFINEANPLKPSTSSSRPSRPATPSADGEEEVQRSSRASLDLSIDPDDPSMN
jgi:Sec-independent protein translocase protein TatA